VIFFDLSVSARWPHGRDESEVMERRLQRRAIILLVGMERQELHLDIQMPVAVLTNGGHFPRNSGSGLVS
jgi:hypothetical protein